MIAKEKKQAIIKEFGRTEGDTGSPEVQVAILTARINEFLVLFVLFLENYLLLIIEYDII